MAVKKRQPHLCDTMSVKKQRQARGVAVPCTLFVTILMLVLIFLPAPKVQAAGNWTHSAVEKATADIRVNQDGTVDITETIVYRFDKPKTSLSFDLIFPFQGEPRLTSFEVAQTTTEMSEKFITIPQRDELRPQPIFFTTTRKNDRIRINLQMTAFTGDFVFRIGYQWNRGVVHKEGQALMSGPLLVVRPETPVDTMRWTITMPAGCRLDLSRIVPVTMHSMTINKVSETCISLVDNRPFFKNDGVGIVISVPADCFPLILPASDSDTFETILANASSRSKYLTRLETLRRSISRIVVPLTIVGILLIYTFFYMIQILRRKRLSRDFAYWPTTASPAIVARLARIRPIDSRLLLAAIASLVNRKEIEAVDEVLIWKHPERNDFSDFTTWETLLLQWLFAYDPEYGHVLAPERLRVAARQSDFRELAHRFREHIDNEFAESGLIDPRLTRFFRAGFFLFAFLFLIMSTVFFVLTHAVFALLLMIPALLFTISGITFRFLTKEGVLRYHESREFSKQLTSPLKLISSCSGRLTDIETLISALPAAIAINKRKNYFQGIRSLSRRSFLHASYALLHVYRKVPFPAAPGIPPGDIDAEIARVTRDLDEMERILTAWKEFFDSCFI
ncbi:MAG: DUF2207 domain-containing protein [Clostridiaceae bacterium]|nr:DUF2207 domain-containing protein [Clostridiaceae bacterium]